MNSRIYGRPAGSHQAMSLLIEVEPPAPGGDVAEPARVAAARLRAEGVEGYVVFGDDPTPYAFSPEADFVYPATAPACLAELPESREIALGGHTWYATHWSRRTELRLATRSGPRDVVISETRSGDEAQPVYEYGASVRPRDLREKLEACRTDFPSAEAAIAWAMCVDFPTRRAGPLTWRASVPAAASWYACIDDTLAEIDYRPGTDGVPCYAVTRSLTLGGQRIEFRITDLATDDTTRSIASFEQASAIALTMVDYVLGMMRLPPAAGSPA
ncbi:hypothetical protein [Burkholderia glumae]|uniref:hypothetical protein n=1 Tax=Burkholderia glumae TaxID=337 RepID=UPI003BA23BE1